MFDDIRRKIRCHRNLRKHIRTMNTYMKGKHDRTAFLKSMILKNCHSIEKGFTSRAIRYGFGKEKINLIISYTNELYILDQQAYEIKIAIAVLKFYLEQHKAANYQSEEFDALSAEISRLLSGLPDVNISGGVIELNVNECDNSFDAFEKLVKSRHSIRSFKNEKVDENIIVKSIQTAMLAPSACNRQTTRAYVVDRSDFDKLKGWDAGVKTFLDQVDKIIIITGQMSAYNGDEFFQYAVSAGIFTAYLTLAFHAQGIGCCILERPLYSNELWERIKRDLGIPENEQSICAVAIGVPMEKQKVPVSARLPYEIIAKHVGEYYKTKKGN